MPSSIQPTSSQIVATTFERVNDKLPEYLVSKESRFMQMFKKSNPKHQVVSSWGAGTVGSGGVQAFRVPVLLAKGGDYQAFNLDGGDLGTGSMMDTAFMTLGYYATNIAYQVPMLAAFATKTSAQAIRNVLQVSIEQAIGEMSVYNEIGVFQDGTGILATATAVSGTGAGPITYTLETAQFTFIRLRSMQTLVDVVTSGNVVKASSWRITNINQTANQVTIAPSGFGTASYTSAATDQLVMPGMAPVGNTITAGSFRNGIYTFNTTNTSGSLLGLPYATASELACPQVNAAGGFYTPSVAFSGKSQLVQRRDDTAIMGMVGVSHMAQRASYYLQGVTIANVFLHPGEALKSSDLAGQGTDYPDTYEVADITHYVSRYANKSRVDWINPKNFGWVQLSDIAFITTPEGQRTFIGHSTTTGNPTAGYQFYAHNTQNLYSCDPGCSNVIYSLAIPFGQ
jgi:hypothetical protein